MHTGAPGNVQLSFASKLTYISPKFTNPGAHWWLRNILFLSLAHPLRQAAQISSGHAWIHGNDRVVDSYKRKWNQSCQFATGQIRGETKAKHCRDARAFSAKTTPLCSAETMEPNTETLEKITPWRTLSLASPEPAANPRNQWAMADSDRDRLRASIAPKGIQFW